MRNVKCYDSDGNILKLLYQWDCNQTLYFTGIPTSPTPVFHFCNKNSVEALVVNSTRMDDGVIVDVPNILLQDSDPLIIFIYLNTGNDGGRTIHAMQVPVVKRVKPDDYEYTDNTPIITASFVNARLSELISEISDGAEGDLAVEVYDIRVGADGTVYQTAGDAVRYLEQDVRSIQAEIDEIERGLSESAKQALLSCFQHVAWIDEHGQDYYNDLYDALYTTASIRLDTHFVLLNSIGATSQLIATTVPAGGRVTWTSSDTSVATVTANGLVTSVGYGDAIITASSGSVSATCGVSVAEATVLYISAVYTPSGNVYTTDTLDSLKSDLVVTAAWSNGSTTTVQDSYYELSGTLSQGINVITVSFGGKTDTFEVEAIESVESISATFNSGGTTIYTDNSLNDLKQYLTVTYTLNGNDTVLQDSDYTLSGTLVAGTSTITVTYEDLMSSFTVNVTSHTIYSLPAETVFDGTQNYVDTGVPLFNHDRSYTILIDFTEGNVDYSPSTKVAMGLMTLANDSGNSISIYKGTSAQNVNTDVRIGAASYITRSPKENSGNRRIIIALSHSEWGTSFNIAVSYDGSLMTPSSDNRSNYSFTEKSSNIILGSNAQNTEPLIGTMHEFVIYDYALTQAELEAYVTRNN